jgi:hypothetical protein
MKLRILDSTLRLRLDRAEVEALGRGEAQQAATRFPGGEAFGYRLEPTSEGIGATYDDRGITLRVPSEQLQAWVLDEQQVGICESLALSDGVLVLLIEKDFECLEPRKGEDQSNRFVNPKAL